MTRFAMSSAIGLVAVALFLAGSAGAGGSTATSAQRDASTDAAPADASTNAATEDASATSTTDAGAPSDAAVAPAPRDAAAPLVTVAEKPMVRARRRPKPRYGAAGCGLGSIIFGPKPGLTQVTAASTNTLGGQTFGITSGTENCDSIDDHETLDSFVTMNREALMKDVARGSGETIATITAIAGCADPVTVGQKLKGSFAKIFPNARVGNEQIARTMRQVLRADAALACENLPE